MQVIWLDMTSEQIARPRPAGFWIRFLAYLIDLALIWAGFLALYFAGFESVLDLDPPGYGEIEPSSNVSRSLPGFIVFVLVAWLYEAILTSSRHQATVGKLLLNLKVVDENYDRIGFALATFRHMLKYVSHFVLEIGFIMIAFRESKEGLHDLMAGTYVIHAP